MLWPPLSATASGHERSRRGGLLMRGQGRERDSTRQWARTSYRQACNASRRRSAPAPIGMRLQRNSVRRPRGNEARRAAKPALRPLSGTRFGRNSSLRPYGRGAAPATGEGSLLLVVPYQQRLGARHRLPPSPDARRRVRLRVAADRDFRATALATGRARQSSPAARWLISLARHVSQNFVLAVATPAVAVGTPRDPVALSRASLPVASRRASRGVLRWPGRLRSCSRRGLVCSSGSQHRDRSAA
jgi:hypothetical protein